MKTWIADRLGDRNTILGGITAFSALTGIAISPDHMTIILAIAGAISTIINVVAKDGGWR